MARSMIPIIADTNFNRIGQIEDFSSFIWTQRYYTSGDFELCVPIASKGRAFLQKDYYVMREGIDDVGIIQRIQIARDANGHEQMVVSGQFLTSVLGRRIIAVQTQVSGTVGDCVKRLIYDNAINPSDSARRIPNLTFGSFSGAGAQMEQQFTGVNLLDAVSEICENNSLGMRTVLGEGNRFEFSLFSGVDRSYNQDANAYVIFSTEYDNLASSDYDESYEHIVTDVLVAGEGEGLDRKTVWARKETLTGLKRYELYQDARNSSTNDGAISQSTYLQQLKEEGLEQITSITQAFAGEVYLRNYELGVNVDIGDVVVIENSRWGIGMNARIIEIIESMSASGVYSAVPTFAQVMETGALVDDNAYIDDEFSDDIVTESLDVLIQEGSTFDVSSSPYQSAKKISELDEVATLSEGDLFVISHGNGSNKLAYSTLKAQMLDYNELSNKPSIESVTLQGDKTFGALGLNNLTNGEIDRLLT